MRPASHTREPAMSKRHLLSPSIQKTLFIWVLPTMVVGMVLSLLLSVALLEEQAETAFDRTLAGVLQAIEADRKSTRLNSSHVAISYAVFCLKKKKKKRTRTTPHT